MKTKYLILILILFLSTPNIYTQDLMDALKQTAEMHNEQHGDDSGDDRELSEEERERIENYWKEKTKDTGEFIESLNKPYHQCLALMGLYSYHFQTLLNAAKEEENCKMKYDWYGMALLMNISGTFLIPCTEGFYNLPEEDQKSIFHDFLNSLYHCKGGYGSTNGEVVWTPLAKKAPKTAKDIHLGFFQAMCYNDEAMNYHVLKKVYYYIFEWEAIMHNTLEIGRKMEALGCG